MDAKYDVRAATIVAVARHNQPTILGVAQVTPTH